MGRMVYMNFDTGSNSGSGAESAPYLDRNGYTPADGDTLNVAGTLRPSRSDTKATFAAKLLAFTSRAGFKIKRWGDAAVRVSGAWQTRAAEWVLDTGTTWKIASIGTVLIANVTYKFDDQSRWVTCLDGITKVPAAFLSNAGSAASCRTTINSYYYDGTDLYINVGSSTAPADGDIECCIGNTTASNADNDLNGITISSCTDFEIDLDGWTIDRVGLNSDSDGYGFILQSCQRGIVRKGRLICCGYHSCGATGSAPTDITIEDTKMIGCGRTSTNVIFFSADTGNIKRCRGLRMLAAVVPPVKPDGQYLASVNGMTGFYSHTTPAGAGSPRVEDLSLDRCVAVTYQPPGAGISDVAGFSTADTLSRPTVNSIDEVTLASYNVRVTNSVMIGCTRRAAVNDTYTSAIAFSRTLQVLGCYTSQNTQSVNTALNGWLSDATDTANRKSTMFVEHSLDIIAYTSGGNRPMIYGATSHNSQKRVVYRNNTMLIDCEPNRDVYVFQAQFNAATANTNTMRLENNLIIKVQAGNVAAVFNANSAESLATCNATIFTPVEGNIFYLPGGTVTWSEATSIDTQAEFITAFGVRNYIAVDPGMASGRMNPQLLATGLAAQTNHPLVPAAATSLNGGPWNGAGCWNPRGRALANVNLQELSNLVLQAA